jgi:hypothetical protein
METKTHEKYENSQCRTTRLIQLLIKLKFSGKIQLPANGAI